MGGRTIWFIGLLGKTARGLPYGTFRTVRRTPPLVEPASGQTPTIREPRRKILFRPERGG